MVIRKGEDILAGIDDRAIKEIRAKKLAWRYWDDPSELQMEQFSAGAAIGLRILENVDHEALARIAISILWRAGTSRTVDFRNFNVPESLLERARETIVGNMPFDAEVFPIKVFQFVTKGPIHNLTPMNHILTRPDKKLEPFFRIFANGLVFHIVDTTVSQPYDLGEAKWYLGKSDILTVIGFDYHLSAQAEFAASVYSQVDSFLENRQKH
ncbi:MAG TPA: hypothetical protein ENJ52_01170 [Aliiroseovarius sp.]|nr:hypothetical protein [Aliiroseovarius sp.]